MHEDWKQVVGYEGLYEVSDRGRVRSVGRTRLQRNKHGGENEVWYPGRVLRPGVLATGYKNVGLSNCRRVVHPYIHHLVLEAFVGPRPEGMECCHNNGDNGDNRLVNLRWDTPKNNHADKRRHGTLLRGEAVSGSKLSAKDIPRIRSMVAAGATRKAVAKIFGVSRPTISFICSGKRWGHV